MLPSLALRQAKERSDPSLRPPLPLECCDTNEGNTTNHEHNRHRFRLDIIEYTLYLYNQKLVSHLLTSTPTILMRRNRL